MTINEIAQLFGKQADGEWKNKLQYARALTRAINKIVPVEERGENSSHLLMIEAGEWNRNQLS